MTVKQMIEKLQALPQDAVCVVPGPDHSYRGHIHPQLALAEKSPRGHIMEYYEGAVLGPEHVVVEIVVLC